MDAGQIREVVSQTYTKAKSVNGNAVAKLAGYRPEDFELLPESMTGATFGCGNPLSYTEVQPGSVIVDLGSGAGLDLLIASKHTGPTGKVIGVDMTDAMIERARANIAASGKTNIEVRKGLIEKLPIESNSADWVISNCVISLSPEKEKVFSEIARVLKPGGRMLISDIVAQGFPPWLLWTMQKYSANLQGVTSEVVYLEGLRRAGLTSVAVRDRLMYETEQVLEVMDDAVASLGESSCPAVNSLTRFAGKLSDNTKEKLFRVALNYAEGKVWSAKFYAQKVIMD